MKKFLYFQPEYVSRFKCDGSKCSARCCKGWTIEIDAATYKKYSRIKPKEKAKEILSHFKFDPKKNLYVVRLDQTFSFENLDGEQKVFSINPDKKFSCPFLTEKKLCGLQLEYGEEFLSQTCATYPRITYNFGKFFERSLTLSCPVAAEIILFSEEPLAFEFVEVLEKIHGKHGRIRILKLPTNEDAAELIREAQVTMISILQARKFSLDQRLIVLGFFLDKLGEILPVKDEAARDNLLDLIAAYRSEEFLTREMLPLAQSIDFDAHRFILFMMNFIGYTLEILRVEEGRKFFAALEKVLGIKPDENSLVSVDEIAANFDRLADARKIFSEKYSTFLENYLVSNLFRGVWPWRFRDHSLTKNFIIFLISYKIFELITFATVHDGLDSKEDLLAMVDWFMTKTDHDQRLYKRFFELLAGVDDTYLLMATLL